jgi:predicted nucleotidyltransferase
MVTQNRVVQYLQVNKQEMSRKYHLSKLGIFGSYARNEQTPASDLDLLVEFEENTPNLSHIKEILRNDMQSVFRVPVDICREKYIKPLFRKQILSDAVYV